MDERTTYGATDYNRRVSDLPPATSTIPPTPPLREPVAPTTATTRPAGEPIVGRTVATERRVAPAGEVEPPVGERRFSVGATFLGWACASFFSLVFLAIVAGFLGGNAVNQYYAGDTIDTGEIQAYGIGALVGVIAATFLAFLIGGYAAGRISLWDGVKHGALIVVWPILFAVLGIAIGAALGDDFVAATGINFAIADMDQLTGGAIIGIVATLLAMLAGGALGGRLGERYHEGLYGAERRRTFARGRTY